jgi:hypothetical protein
MPANTFVGHHLQRRGVVMYDQSCVASLFPLALFGCLFTQNLKRIWMVHCKTRCA